MASVRKVGFQQTVTSLEAVSVLKQVEKLHKTVELLNKLPAATVQNLPDVERPISGVPGTDEMLTAITSIKLWGKLDNESLVEDMEDVIEAVINELISDIPTFRDLTPSVYITRVEVVDGPDIDIERDRSFAEIEVEYHN